MNEEEKIKNELTIIGIVRAFKKMLLVVDDQEIEELEHRLLEKMTILIQK